MRSTAHTEEGDHGDQGRAVPPDPAGQGPAGRPAAGDPVRAVQRVPNPRLPVQGGTAAEARALPPAELHPSRAQPHRDRALRRPRRGPGSDRQLPEASRTHRPVDRRGHRTRPPPAQPEAIGQRHQPAAVAPSLEPRTGLSGPPLETAGTYTPPAPGTTMVNTRLRTMRLSVRAIVSHRSLRREATPAAFVPTPPVPAAESRETPSITAR